MMTLRQIRHFIAVAETGSISAAAQAVYISQSTLTQAIQQLEEEIGVALFNRHAKGMSLTHQGHQFLRQAHLILATVDNAKRSLQQSTDQVAGQRLTLGGVGLVDAAQAVAALSTDAKNSLLRGMADALEVDADAILAKRPAAIILSGGPSSVYADGAPRLDPRLLEAGVPVLGICYGFQAMAYALGADVDKAALGEYGKTETTIDKAEGLLDGSPAEQSTWMSHGVAVKTAPEGFEVLAHTEGAPVAAMQDESRKLYGVQWHPEFSFRVNVDSRKIFKAFIESC